MRDGTVIGLAVLSNETDAAERGLQYIREHFRHFDFMGRMLRMDSNTFLVLDEEGTCLRRLATRVVRRDCGQAASSSSGSESRIRYSLHPSDAGQGQLTTRENAPDAEEAALPAARNICMVSTTSAAEAAVLFADDDAVIDRRSIVWHAEPDPL